MKAALSLHLRLTGLLALLLAVLVGVAFIYAERRSDEIARRDVDERLRLGATLILETLEKSRPDGSVLPRADDLDARRSDQAIVPAYELRDVDGRIVARSIDFPADMGQTWDGFSNQTGDGQEWRVFTLSDADLGLTGRLAINDDDTTRIARTSRSDILVPLVAALVVLAIAAVGTIWIGLWPLRRIERAIGGLDFVRTRQLEISPDKMPRELSRLTRTLNDLLDRLQRLMRHQKAFVAAAGHELRTPLAGCATQLEVARRSMTSAQRDHALTKLDQGLRRMGALVEQLLVIARSEQSSLDVEGVPFSLNELLREIVEDQSSEETEVILDEGSEPIRVSGHPDLVASMITNLVRNALRVSPPGEAVNVALTDLGTDARIQVCDCGPGLTREQKSKVFDSFYSGDDGSGPGTGLGLAIVKAVVLAHRGKVAVLNRDPCGLCVEITLPRSV